MVSTRLEVKQIDPTGMKMLHISRRFVYICKHYHEMKTLSISLNEKILTIIWKKLSYDEWVR